VGGAVGVAVEDGAGVAVSWGAAGPVATPVTVEAMNVVASGVEVVTLSVLLVAVGRGGVEGSRWKGVAPPKNASVATTAMTSVAATAASVSVLDGRRGCHGRCAEGGS
jgi:hypothetical protein